MALYSQNTGEGNTKEAPATPLPNFIVGGVGKAGTTSLYYYLNQHPEVYLSPIKETNFFAADFIDFGNLRPDIKASRSLDVEKYVAGDMEKIIFGANVRDSDHYRKLFSKVSGEKAIGEVNPNYFVVPQSFRKMREVIPDAKQILILRNPVERAFSSWVMHYREGRERERDFLSAVKKDYNRKEKGWGISFNYLDTGLYAERLKILLEAYPRSLIRIYLFEEFKEDSPGLLEDLFEFIGVDTNFKPDMQQKYNKAASPRFPALNRFLLKSGMREWARRRLPPGLQKLVVRLNYSAKKSALPAMDKETRSWLREFFREDIGETSKLINRDLSHWLR